MLERLCRRETLKKRDCEGLKLCRRDFEGERLCRRETHKSYSACQLSFPFRRETLQEKDFQAFFSMPAFFSFAEERLSRRETPKPYSSLSFPLQKKDFAGETLKLCKLSFPLQERD